MAFALGITGATATASQRIEMSFDDNWVFQTYEPETPPESTPVGKATLGYPATGEDGGSLKLSGPIASDGTFSIPGDQFVLEVQSPGASNLNFVATGDITGTFDRSNGRTTMKFPTEYVMGATNPSPLPGSPSSIKCSIGGFTTDLVTEGQLTMTDGTVPVGSPFFGKPFVGGEGSLLGGWSTPKEDLEVKSLDGTPSFYCDMLLHSMGSEDFEGAMWLSGSAEVTGTSDQVCAPGELGTWPDCVAPTCPTGTAGTPPNCGEPAVISAFSLKGPKAKLKAGKSARLKLRVQNSSNQARSIKVEVKSSNRQVKVPKRITVRVPARTALITGIKVRATAKAKGRAKITAKTEGLTARTTVLIKKARR